MKNTHLNAIIINKLTTIFLLLTYCQLCVHCEDVNQVYKMLEASLALGSNKWSHTYAYNTKR